MTEVVDATMPKHVMVMILVGLPLMTPCMVWLLGFAVSHVRDKAAPSWLLGTLLTLIMATVAVASVPWAIYYTHATYNWFVDQWFLVLVVPWTIALFVSYLVGERRQTLSELLSNTLDQVGEIVDDT